MSYRVGHNSVEKQIKEDFFYEVINNFPHTFVHLFKHV